MIEGDVINTIPEPLRNGYEFLGWYVEGSKVTLPITVSDNILFQARWKKIDTNKYVVNHFKKTLINNYELDYTQTLDGAIGEMTNAKALSYIGFAANDFEQITITNDDNLEINIFYDRMEYSVTADCNDGGSVTGGNCNVVYGDTVIVKAQLDSGYLFDGWYLNGKYVTNQLEYSFIMPANNVSLEAKFSLEYTLRIFQQGYAEDAWNLKSTMKFSSSGLLMNEAMKITFEGFYDFDYSLINIVNGSVDLKFERMKFDVTVLYNGGEPIVKSYYYNEMAAKFVPEHSSVLYNKRLFEIME